MHTVYINAASLFFSVFAGENLLTTDEHDTFILSQAMISAMGEELERSGSLIPSIMGERPKNIATKRFEFEATTWQDWLLHYAPIQLKGRLPNPHYKMWLGFVRACQILTAAEQTLQEVGEAEDALNAWIQHFEK